MRDAMHQGMQQGVWRTQGAAVERGHAPRARREFGKAGQRLQHRRIDECVMHIDGGASTVTTMKMTLPGDQRVGQFTLCRETDSLEHVLHGVQRAGRHQEIDVRVRPQPWCGISGITQCRSFEHQGVNACLLQPERNRANGVTLASSSRRSGAFRVNDAVDE